MQSVDPTIPLIEPLKDTVSSVSRAETSSSIKRGAMQVGKVVGNFHTYVTQKSESASKKAGEHSYTLLKLLLNPLARLGALCRIGEIAGKVQEAIAVSIGFIIKKIVLGITFAFNVVPYLAGIIGIVSVVTPSPTLLGTFAVASGASAGAIVLANKEIENTKQEKASQKLLPENEGVENISVAPPEPSAPPASSIEEEVETDPNFPDSQISEQPVLEEEAAADLSPQPSAPAGPPATDPQDSTAELPSDPALLPEDPALEQEPALDSSLEPAQKDSAAQSSENQASSRFSISSSLKQLTSLVGVPARLASAAFTSGKEKLISTKNDLEKKVGQVKDVYNNHNKLVQLTGIIATTGAVALLFTLYRGSLLKIREEYVDKSIKYIANSQVSLISSAMSSTAGLASTLASSTTSLSINGLRQDIMTKTGLDSVNDLLKPSYSYVRSFAQTLSNTTQSGVSQLQNISGSTWQFLSKAELPFSTPSLLTIGGGVALLVGTGAAILLARKYFFPRPANQGQQQVPAAAQQAAPAVVGQQAPAAAQQVAPVVVGQQAPAAAQQAAPAVVGQQAPAAAQQAAPVVVGQQAPAAAQQAAPAVVGQQQPHKRRKKHRAARP